MLSNALIGLFLNKEECLKYNNENIKSNIVKDKTLKKKIREFCKNTVEDECKFKRIKKIYHLEPQRASRFSKLFQNKILSDGSNAVCVCGQKLENEYDDNNKITESIVLLNDSKTEPIEILRRNCCIMYDELDLISFPEYKFSENDEWKISSAGIENILSWRSSLFKLYESRIRMTPPECMKGLRRMLWEGPVTNLYESVNNNIFPIPDDEKHHWVIVNTNNIGKKVTTYIPRKLHSLRIWNPLFRCYLRVETKLENSPQNPEKWFINLVKYLKSNLHGHHALDQETLNINENDIVSSKFLELIKEKGDSKWSQYVMEIKGEIKKIS